MKDNNNLLHKEAHHSSSEEEVYQDSHQTPPKQEVTRTVPLKWVYGVMLIMLITGCANTIVLKVMDEIHVHGTNYDYIHPYFQSIIMFFGESLCLAVHLCITSNKSSPSAQRAAQANLPPTNNFFILGFPGAMDFCGSTITFIALGLVPASVYQMMKGFIVVITCLFSFIFLRKPYFRHHWLGVVLVTGGIILVGVAAIVFGSGEEDSGSSGSLIAGVVILIIAQFFTATQFLIESRLFDKYYIPPLKLVGYEGLMGLSITIVFITIFAFIPCPSNDFCEVPYDYFTSPIKAMTELVTPATILVCALGIILSISFFNFSGVSVTKYTTAGHRAVIDTSRTVLIWIFFLALGQQDFLWLQLIGFLFLTFGTLVFNEVIRLPCCRLNLFTVAAMKARAQNAADQNQLMPPIYMASSPAPYDYSRMNGSMKQRAASHFSKQSEKGSRVLTRTH